MSEVFEVLGTYLGRVTALLSWDNVKIVTGGIVLLWVGLAVNRRLGLFSGLSGLATSLVSEPVSGLRSRQEAIAAEKAGDFLEAGLQYDKVGDWEKALDCFEKAEEYHLAGELCLRLGHKEVAAEWFLQSKEKLKAAQLYRELGRHDKAADAYLKAGGRRSRPQPSSSRRESMRRRPRSSSGRETS